MDLMAIYSKIKKRQGRARILASTLVQLRDGRVAKVVMETALKFVGLSKNNLMMNPES